MITRFIICVGEGADSALRESRATSASNLQMERISSHCSIAFDSATKVYLLPNKKGAVVGTLFHRHGNGEPITKIGAGDAAAICNSGFGFLLDRFWGGYIAIRETANGTNILRDPSGMVPCCYIKIGNAFVFASRPDLLVDAGFLDPTVAWDALEWILVFQGLPSEETAIVGVKDLLPGAGIEIVGSQAQIRHFWNPWDFVRPCTRHSALENAEQLRRAGRSCISAWSRRYGRGLVGLSGGLDSSIVTVGLKAAGNELSCLTLVTDDPIGDERPYCRAVAQACGIPLVEEAYSLDDVDLGQSSVSHRPRPLGRADALAYDAAIIRAVHAAKANAFFTGNGGDNVFYMSRSARAVADCLIETGLSAALWRTIRNISVLTGASIFQVIAQGLRARRRARDRYRWQPDVSFLSRELVERHAHSIGQHPWLQSERDHDLPGKAAHIAMLLRIQHSIEVYDHRGGIPFVHPLVSQPIMELCLAIPTWQQSEGGRDRAVARLAFEGDLPRDVANRGLKGSPQGFTYDIFRTFQGTIRERLLDGALSRFGIVDRAQIEKALQSDAQNSPIKILRLLLLTDTEAWIAYWQSRQGGSGASRASEVCARDLNNQSLSIL